MDRGKSVYIASSWKNQHGVEMLTKMLRDLGFTVISWIENNYGEGHAYNEIQNFEEWVQTLGAEKAWRFDVDGAKECDILIYYGNAGKDASFECGIAFANGAVMLGLYAKGEDFGLMRRSFDHWFYTYEDLVRCMEGTEFNSNI